ncbi:MAG TPA: glycerol-3-phosphate acyltransferase [Acidimicrobiia bacterium]|nr:glycerol-3-phosphate acyltransferase [Acidimicrobiia bacterium]
MNGPGALSAAVLGYLIGSFPSADVASRLAMSNAIDLRTLGSGNPGATNAAQVLGKQWGAMVLLVDLGKGVGAVFVGRALGGDAGAYVAAVMVVAGHIVPPWSRFRGGKGMATVGGVVLAVLPLYFPFAVALAAAFAFGTHRTELAARVSAVALVTAAIVWTVASWPNGWGPAPGGGLVAFAIADALLIVVKFALARAPEPAS